jgi:hypothetical protein
MRRRHAISPGFFGHYQDLGMLSLKRHGSAGNRILSVGTLHQGFCATGCKGPPNKPCVGAAVLGLGGMFGGGGRTTQRTTSRAEPPMTQLEGGGPFEGGARPIPLVPHSGHDIAPSPGAPSARLPHPTLGMISQFSWHPFCHHVGGRGCQDNSSPANPSLLI